MLNVANAAADIKNYLGDLGQANRSISSCFSILDAEDEDQLQISS